MKYLVTYNRTRDIQIYDYENADNLIALIMHDTNMTEEEAIEEMEGMIEGNEELIDPDWTCYRNGAEIVLGQTEADSEEEAKDYFSPNPYMKERMRVYTLS